MAVLSKEKEKCPKLQSKWEGPYLVKEHLNELICRIVRSPQANPKVVHINRLARFEDLRQLSMKWKEYFGHKKNQEQENGSREQEQKDSRRKKHNRARLTQPLDLKSPRSGRPLFARGAMLAQRGVHVSTEEASS